MRALNLINEKIIHIIKTIDPKFNIRVPLSCLIDYKGFTCLVNTDIGIKG